MATPSIKTTLKLDGEKEYKAALSEINSALKVLNSEMKLTKEQFAEQADSVEALTAEHDVLERQYLTQKEKVDALRGALEQAAQTYGEASTKTNSYRTSLNNAETDLLKLERALKDNEAALEQTKTAAQSTGDGYDDMDQSLSDAADGAKQSGGIIGQLKDIFGDVSDGGKSMGEVMDTLTGAVGVNLPDGAKKALDALGPMSGTIGAIAGAAVAAATAIAQVEEALISITEESAERATSISNVAETINMSVESTQKWDYVLKTVGSSIEQAQGDLSAFQEKILEASEGSGEAYEMFVRLGVSVKDQVTGSLRETEPVLMDVITALQRMADETERNAISSTLLGGTGEALIPLYNDNTQAIEHLMQRKEELGILTGEGIESLKKVSQSMIDYEERTNNAKDTLAKDFAPALTDFNETAGKVLQDLAESAEKSNLVTFFGTMLDLVSALAPAIELLGSAFEILAPILGIASIALGGVADALRIIFELLSAIGNILTLDFSGAGQNWDNIMGIFSGKGSATANAWQAAFNAPGTDNFPGGVTWVGENGPEQVFLPRGTQILNAQESRMSGGDVFYITIEARTVQEFMDIVRMAQAQRRMQRMEAP